MAGAALTPSGLASLLPDSAICSESGEEEVTASFAQEERLVATATSGRRSEFFGGRACARRALRGFGVPDAPIGRIGRRPVWPDGFVGSITHCSGYRAAAVARARDLVALGIDAEPNAALPRNVLRLIASTAERDALAELPDAGPHWDRLLFSAKESVFKAWSPVMDTQLGFKEAEIEIDPAAGRFRARLLGAPLVLPNRATTVVHGRWGRSGDLLLTALAIPSLALSDDPVEFRG
ncbi:4'-phosphopantetheinyl transferase family protein [Actinomyces oricola]